MRVENYTVPFITFLLKNKGKLQEKRYYKGDIEACDLLIDLELLLKESKLTDKQYYILHKHLVEGVIQEDLAKMLGTSQQMIDKHIAAAKRRFEKVLLKWGEI